MRKLLLLFIVALAVAIAIYMGIGSDSYFLLRIGDWAMQMTLFVAFLAAVFAVILVRIFWGLFRGIFLGAWPEAWRSRRQKSLTRDALENLAIGNWSVARKDFVRLANQTEKPIPLVILSAQASEAMADYKEAKAVYLHTLEEFPEWSRVAYLRLCNIALSEGDLDKAGEYIVELDRLGADNAELQMLKARLAEERRDWDALQNVLEAGRKKKLFGPQMTPIERRYFYTRLEKRPGAGELLKIKDYVLALDSVAVDIVAKLAQLLALRGQGKEAEALTRKVLNKNWSEELMDVYAELEAQSPRKQLKTAEGWLTSHGESEALLEGLQKLAVRAGEDSKIESYGTQLEELAGTEPDLLPEKVSS